MSRGRRSRKRSTHSRAYIVFACVIVGLLILGTVASVVADRGSNDDTSDPQDPEVQITPGAEIARLQTQVAANPDDVDSLVVLAEILANSGRAGESVPLFESAVERRPEDPALRLAFGRALLRSSSVFDAEIQLVKATELDPDDQAAAFYLAQVYEAKGEAGVDRARSWYQRAIDLSPDSLIADQAREALEFLGPPETATPEDQG
jgi:cytochrome c-type biogenesis protein CcmH/NrfG